MKAKLIVALDVEKLETAEHLVRQLCPAVGLFKIGSQLYTAYGPKAVEMVEKMGGRVFLDLKFHDIPNTVYGAVASGTSSPIAIQSIPSRFGAAKTEDQARESIRPPVFMMTVHALGGLEMLRAAVKGASDKAAELKIERPCLVGVTVLTSETSNENVSEIVLERASLAKDAGLDGVVCAVSEAAMIRKNFGKKFIIVTPGIRFQGAALGDQKRVASPEAAVRAGSDYLVVGRPVVEAENPVRAVKEVLEQMHNAH